MAAVIYVVRVHGPIDRVGGVASVDRRALDSTPGVAVSQAVTVVLSAAARVGCCAGSMLPNYGEPAFPPRCVFSGSSLTYGGVVEGGKELSIIFILLYVS